MDRLRFLNMSTYFVESFDSLTQHHTPSYIFEGDDKYSKCLNVHMVEYIHTNLMCCFKMSQTCLNIHNLIICFKIVDLFE